MKRHHGIGLGVGMVVAWLAATVPAGAQTPASTPGPELTKLRNEVSELSLEMLRTEATAAEIQAEEGLVAPALQRGGEADAKSLSAANDVWEDISKRINSEEDPRTPTARVQMEKVKDVIEKDETKAVAAWKQAMEQDLAFQDEVNSAERLVGWSWKGKPPNVNLSIAVIAQGILAVVGGLVLTLHELRGRLRWRLRSLGSRPSAIVVALLLPLAAALGAAPGPGDEPENPPAAGGPVVVAGRDASALKEWREDLQKKLKTKQEANEAAMEQLRLHLEAVRHARAAHGLRFENQDQKELVARAEKIEAGIQDQFQKVRVSARIVSSAIQDAERLASQLEKDSKDLDVWVGMSGGQVKSISILSLVACGLFILVAVVPLVRVRRRRRVQLSEESRKCPRCLNLDTLFVDTSGSDDDDGGSQVKFRKMVCNVCDYEIRENYIRQNRLCFPTVGVRSSGKTHWMIMLYDMIKNSNIPVASAIRKIPSREDALFDQLVRDLLYSGQAPNASVLGLPYPLTFHIHDADPFGPNMSMVNLFDFSGELRNLNIDQHEFRRRALLCDGFTLFLDPTQVSEGSKGAIEDQIETLATFAEEMHAIRGLASEIPVDLPIAICVSKMDLLVNNNPMGTQAISMVKELRKTLTQKVDLSLIHERSQLCAEAMPLMFPGWNIERMLRENFGGRYMFFPMSSVGLEEAELGIHELRERTIAAFGMIEPLLWLLHMHGYCVFH